MDAYFNPVRTFLGRGAVSRIRDVASELGSRRILVVEWSEEVEQIPAFRELEAMEGTELSFKPFTASNPTVEQLFAFMQECGAFKPDLVVSVGGGSVMDVAKSMCAMGFEGYAAAQELRDAIASGRHSGARTPWVGVPTTAGTGSEVTCWATVWDPGCKCKRSIEDRSNYAYAALVDADLSSALPPALAMSSALDAMAHAVESYWARSSNAVSRALALQAVRIIRHSLKDLALGRKEAHDAMAKGSMLVCLGMGPEAGVAGLCVHTTAFFTKSFAQSFEEIPRDTLEAIEATGAGRVSVFMNAVLPAAFSQIVAWCGMRLEVNFSECAILGMVGAGGVGFVIASSLQGYDYGTAGLASLLVFITAFLIERMFVAVKRIFR